MTRIFAAAVLLLAAACFSGYSDEPDPRELRVRRGAFVNDLVISGELEAARGEVLAVPPLPSWQTSIKWLAEDGALVKSGDPVVELDNTALTADLDTKRTTETQAVQELQQREAEWSADLQQKALDVEKKQSDLDKAKLDAAVPSDVVAAREYEDRQTKLRRATVEFEKTADLLTSRRQAIEAERANLVLRIEKARREILAAEQGVQALVLRAPRDGIALVLDHPWEGRKLQPGDTVFVGFPIAMMPDMSTLRVAAALPDVDDGRVDVGQRVIVTLDGYPTQQFTGSVSNISAVAREARRQSLRRSFDVQVALDKLDPERMRPGLSARVVIRRENLPNALLAPRASIDFNGPKPRVRNDDGELIEVQLGSCNAQDCVVAGGLEEGQRLTHVVAPKEEKRG